MTAMGYADDLAAVSGSARVMALNGWVVGVLGEFMALQLAHAKTEYLAKTDGLRRDNMEPEERRIKQALMSTLQVDDESVERRPFAAE
jgi:hypothetical protein